MPKGPRGEKRPADAIGLAVMIGKIATGEIEEVLKVLPKGSVGGQARARVLTPSERKRIAVKAASHRWGQKADPEQETAE